MPQEYGQSQFGPELQMALFGLPQPSSFMGQAIGQLAGIAVSEQLARQQTMAPPPDAELPPNRSRQLRPQEIDLSGYDRDQLLFWSRKYAMGQPEYDPDIVEALSREFQRRRVRERR